ncbi:MAG: LemA family protein [Fimbriimonadaceae bacterium]
MAAQWIETVMGLVVCGGLSLLPVLGYVVATHNRLVTLQNQIRESWANVDVALKRRYDLIPNLVEAVRGYARHEQSLVEAVAAARQRAIRSVGSVAQQARDESALEASLHRLLSVAEAWPELKASAHFLELQRELAKTEDRIAAARRFYNGNVRSYNAMLEMFPSSLVARGRRPAEYFELSGADERRAPSLRTSDGRLGASQASGLYDLPNPDPAADRENRSQTDRA